MGSFHLLVFMDVQAALCSGTELSVNIHINIHDIIIIPINMHNMQYMSHIEFLFKLFMQDIIDSCNSHNTWDTKFNGCP